MWTLAVAPLPAYETEACTITTQVVLLNCHCCCPTPPLGLHALPASRILGMRHVVWGLAQQSTSCGHIPVLCSRDSTTDIPPLLPLPHPRQLPSLIAVVVLTACQQSRALPETMPVVLTAGGLIHGQGGRSVVTVGCIFLWEVYGGRTCVWGSV